MVISLGSTFFLYAFSVLLNFSMYYLLCQEMQGSCYLFEKKLIIGGALFYLVEGRGLNANVFNSLAILILNKWEGLSSFLKLIKKIIPSYLKMGTHHTLASISVTWCLTPLNVTA